MNTPQSHDLSSLLGRSAAPYDLPTPLFDDDGSGACHPSDENETGP